jgi:hypothetical protein
LVGGFEGGHGMGGGISTQEEQSRQRGAKAW